MSHMKIVQNKVKKEKNIRKIKRKNTKKKFFWFLF